jgi:hypothetical protein
MKTEVILTEDSKFTLDDFTRSTTADKLKVKGQRIITVGTAMRIDELHTHVIVPLLKKFPELEITSGYRDYKTNIAVGGATHSQHLFGEAADLTARNLTDLWYTILEMDIDQAIRYKTHIHVSYRNTKINRKQFIDKTLIAERR